MDRSQRRPPGIGDGQLGLAFIPLRSSAGRWDPPHPWEMGGRRGTVPCDAHDTQVPPLGAGGSVPLGTQSPWVPVTAPASPWGALGAGGGPARVLPTARRNPGGNPAPSPPGQAADRAIPSPGAEVRCSPGAKAEPDAVRGQLRQAQVSWEERNKKQLSPSQCLLGKKIPAWRRWGEPSRSPADVGSSPPLPQTSCTSLVPSLRLFIPPGL